MATMVEQIQCSIELVLGKVKEALKLIKIAIWPIVSEINELPGLYSKTEDKICFTDCFM